MMPVSRTGEVSCLSQQYNVIFFVPTKNKHGYIYMKMNERKDFYRATSPDMGRRGRYVECARPDSIDAGASGVNQHLEYVLLL